MIRGSLFRNPALKICFKREICVKNVRCITCTCRPPRKKVTIRQNSFSFLKTSGPHNNANIRFFCDYPSHYKIALPALSPTMENGTIISWEKKEGDQLNEGDLLAEIETDKATMGFETPEEGYLAKIVVPAGTKNVPVGKLVCIIVQNKEDVAKFKDYKSTGAEISESSPAHPEGKEPAASIPSPPPPPPPTIPPPPPVTHTDKTLTSYSKQEKVYSSPLAKKLAEKQGLKLEKIGSGSGIFGSIKAKDLAGKTQPAQTSNLYDGSSRFEDLPVSSIRKVIAKRLVQAKQTIPHYYLSLDINMDNVLAVRKKLNTLNEKNNIKISINDFIIKAMALACKQVPEANSEWKDSFIRQYNTVDVSVAVNTNEGLMTPIVFDADTKGLATISANMKALVAKAKEGKLELHEFQGGTITVSNLGMLGITSFSAIINPPQTCILAVGATEKRVVPDLKSEKGFKVAEYLTVTLSCDHRVLDGAVGAKWLNVFRNYLENPDLMLL